MGLVVTGLCLGAAQTAKFTCVLLYPVFLILAGTTTRPWSLAGTVRSLGQTAAIFAISIGVINLAYNFSGTGQPLSRYTFSSTGLARLRGEIPGGSTLQRLRSALTAIPLPLPADYLEGIDLQRADFERGKIGYLRGQFKLGGWWYYYLYASLVKIPEGTLALIFLSALSGAMSIWKRKMGAADALFLLLPIVFFFVTASSHTGLNRHFRYVLPVAPFVFIWVSQLFLSPDGNPIARRGRVIATVLVVLSAVSSVATLPHSLSYFNTLSGGPVNGHKHLLNSNIDWGQDLLRLRDWLGSHREVTNLSLAYYGFIDPHVAGVEYELPPVSRDAASRHPIRLPSGWYAVSVNYLVGYPIHVYDGKGRLIPVPPDAFSYFQRLRPTTRIGYSIYLYRLDDMRELSPPE
jgi:hypothetical protein